MAITSFGNEPQHPALIFPLHRNPAPDGMQIFYAIFPRALVQDAPTPHESYDLPGEFYEFRVAREYDPFAEQARRVAD